MQISEINKNPLTKTRFKFVCSKLPQCTFFCQTVTIPGIGLGEASQATPLVDIPMPGDKLVYEDLNFTFVVNEDLDNWVEMKNWLSDAGFDSTLGTDNSPWAELFADGSIVVLSDKSNPVGVFTFEDMWPTSIGALEFDITDADDAVVVADVTFKYTRYTYKSI